MYLRFVPYFILLQVIPASSSRPTDHCNSPEREESFSDPIHESLHYLDYINSLHDDARLEQQLLETTTIRTSEKGSFKQQLELSLSRAEVGHQ